MTDFLVRRDDLRIWRTADGAEVGAPHAGEVQFRVERFGLTANNLTYGAFGDQLGYWRFFDAPDGWGRIPAWGFGVVTASGVEGIVVDDRFYGYFPMSSTVSMQARVDGPGFVECSTARADLPPFYNRYLLATPERGFLPAHDDATRNPARRVARARRPRGWKRPSRASRTCWCAILRPLFTTGWLIADQLDQAEWHGADTVVLASASSKTAFATAFEIGGRRDVVGLTSPAHREFTEGLGCYSRVLTYDEVSAMPVDGGLVLVDMAGSAAVRRTVHEHAGDALRASIMVGATHWDSASLTAADPLPGPTPEFFFAPTQAERRAAELGPGSFQKMVGTAWAAFADRVPDLLEIEFHTGAEALGQAYDALVDGRADPAKGYVFTL